MTRTGDNGGIEYTVRRNSDGAWLSDPDYDGQESSWEPDADDASWTSTLEQALQLADVNGLTTPDYRLDQAYGFWERDWVDEESLTEDSETMEPRPAAQ